MDNKELKDAIRQLLEVIDVLEGQQAIPDNSHGPIVERIRAELAAENLREETIGGQFAIVGIESRYGISGEIIDFIKSEERRVFENYSYSVPCDGYFQEILIPIDQTETTADVFQYLFENDENLATYFYENHEEFADVYEEGGKLEGMHIEIMKKNLRVFSRRVWGDKK